MREGVWRPGTRRWVALGLVVGGLGLVAAGPAAAYDAGDAVVLRVGDGSAALPTTATPGFLEIHKADGTLDTGTNPIALPTAVSGSQLPLTFIGASKIEGELTRAQNGSYIAFAGFDATPGSAIFNSSGATYPRDAGRMNASGALDTSTSLGTTALAGTQGQTFGAYTNDGSQFWVFGTSGTGPGGLFYATLGSSGSTLVLATPLSTIPYTTAAGGQLYAVDASTQSGVPGSVGTGLPSGSSTFTALPGMPAATGANSFTLLDLGEAVAGPDTMYVADSLYTRVDKYSLVSGSWALNGSISLPGASSTNQPRGIAATFTSTGVRLYATTPSSLLSVIDTAGYNAAPSASAATEIATAGSNEAFRGVAIVPAAAPVMSPDHASVDFGDVQTPGPSPATTIKITNTGDDPLNLFTPSFGGIDPGQFSLSNDGCAGKTIAAGGSCTIDVAFAPSTGGAKSASLDFTGHDPAGSLSIPLSGNGLHTNTPPDIYPATPSYDFGDVHVGQNATLSLQISNHGEDTLDIGDVTMGDAQLATTSDTCASQSIGGGNSCYIDVKYTPSGELTLNSHITIASNDPDTPNLQVGFQGRGVATLIDAGTLNDFGHSVVGNPTASQEVEITNSGNTDLTISSVASDSPDFTLTGAGACTAGALGPNDFCDVEVTFQPTATGTRTGTLTVTSDADNGPTTVPLSGTGDGLETTIASHPPRKLRTRTRHVTVGFGFESNSTAAAFRCSVDSRPFASCLSPDKVKVGAGVHTFEVKAVVGGVQDPTPATYTFKVVRRHRHRHHR